MICMIGVWLDCLLLTAKQIISIHSLYMIAIQIQTCSSIHSEMLIDTRDEEERAFDKILSMSTSKRMLVSPSKSGTLKVHF